VLGGALAALASPRAALAVAGGGALLVTAAVWLVLRPATGVLSAEAGDHAAAGTAVARDREPVR
jgi:hypothetical protein